MTTHPTLAKVAASWSLWCDYADPTGEYTREEFDAMSVEQRLAMLRQAFPEAD